MKRLRGVTIIEALVAVAVLGIIVVFVNKYYSTTLKLTRTQEVASIRDHIYQQITRAINPESMANSMAYTNPPDDVGNKFLEACVRQELATPCVHTQPVDQVGFFLMSPEPGGGATIVAGPEGLPRSYKKDGEPSTLGCTDGDCLYRATASWWATCPPLTDGTIPDSCIAAETIWVRVKVITDNPGGAAREGAQKVNSTPPSHLFANHTQFAFPVAAKDIRLIAQSSCNIPGTRMTGYDKFGQPICRCATSCSCGPTIITVGGQTFDSSFGDCGRRGPTCSCVESACDPRTHFMAGLDDNNEAICIPRNSLELCNTINIQTNGDCGEGKQMVNVTYGSCSHSRNPKGGGWKIDCNDDTATCCSNTF